MFRLRSPAFAGLFFALSAFALRDSFAATPVKLAAAGQQYFRSFIEVFTPLVLRREKKGGNPRWGDKNRDCAGLVRYLFWEALERHGEAFYEIYPQLRTLAQPDASAFGKVGASWVRGNYTAPDLIRASRPIGKDLARLKLKTGDLLYYQSAELKIRHVMLVVGAARDVFLVYHTGDSRQELRIRTLADIAALPESEWHPDASNPVFHGVYRPVFLD